MKICLCKDVSDRTIKELARAGASLEQVRAATGAGSGCGQCLLAVARLHAMETAVAGEHAAAARTADRQDPARTAA
jgi:bacterioferritin-associated ferredoxin